MKKIIVIVVTGVIFLSLIAFAAFSISEAVKPSVEPEETSPPVTIEFDTQ